MVGSAQLERAAAELHVTARSLETAVGRHERATGTLERAVEAAASSWISPATARCSGDQRRAVATVGRTAPRLQLAAERSRALASTAVALAEELRAGERAHAAASMSLQAVARRRLGLDPTDDVARSALDDDEQRAHRARRVALGDLEAGAVAWSRACDEAAAALRLAADLIRSEGPVADPLAALATDDLGVLPTAAVLATAERWVQDPRMQGPVDLHGLVLASQQLPATTILLQAWARRGVISVTADLRETAVGVGHLVTLRWGRAGQAMTASRAASRHRVAALDEIVESAADVARRGSGVVRRVGPLPGALGAVGDAFTLANGSEYDGLRGAADRGMSGVGLVSAGLLGVAGIVAFAPIIVGTAVIGATATTAWGLGNLAYDHRDAVGRAARSVRSGVSDAGAAVASGARGALSAVGNVSGSGGGR